MQEVTINKQARLSQHFTLGELCKTSAKTQDGNIPSHVHIENLKRLCGWLEVLRKRYNERYVIPPPCHLERSREISPRAALGRDDNEGREEPIIINSGYRSPAVNKAVGGAPTSNHLTGCAADIRVTGMEQLIRYAAILLDYADETGEEFDELLLEKNRSGAFWLHFAVKPKGNRHKVLFISV